MLKLAIRRCTSNIIRIQKCRELSLQMLALFKLKGSVKEINARVYIRGNMVCEGDVHVCMSMCVCVCACMCVCMF